MVYDVPFDPLSGKCNYYPTVCMAVRINTEEEEEKEKKDGNDNGGDGSGKDEERWHQRVGGVRMADSTHELSEVHVQLLIWMCWAGVPWPWTSLKSSLEMIMEKFQ